MIQGTAWIHLVIAFISIAVSVGAAFAVVRYRINDIARHMDMEVLAEKTQTADYHKAVDSLYVIASEFGKLLSGIYSRLERIENRLTNPFAFNRVGGLIVFFLQLRLRNDQGVKSFI